MSANHVLSRTEQTETVERTVEMKGICLIKDLLIYNTTLYNVEHIAI